MLLGCLYSGSGSLPFLQTAQTVTCFLFNCFSGEVSFSFLWSLNVPTETLLGRLTSPSLEEQEMETSCKVQVVLNFTTWPGWMKELPGMFSFYLVLCQAAVC